MDSEIFEKLPPTKLFFRLAIPSMITMAFSALYQIADGLFVGRFIGEDALAAVNLIMPFIMMVFAFSSMIATGASVRIAVLLGEKRENVMRAMEAIVEPISLYEPIYNDGGDSIYLMDQLSDTSESDESWLENIALKEAMKKLSDRERKIIDLRYYKNKTQTEIAEEIGISQAQVSRLEKGALERIRKQI